MGSLPTHLGWTSSVAAAASRKGESVLLVEAPAVADDGATESIFLVRGSRYAGPKDQTALAVDPLRPGDTIKVADDPTNEANPDALALTAADAVPVGWVPDLLIDHARLVRDAGGEATVVQNNGPEAPWHLRLVVRIAGRVAPGTSTFTGPPWPPISLTHPHIH